MEVRLLQCVTRSPPFIHRSCHAQVALVLHGACPVRKGDCSSVKTKCCAVEEMASGPLQGCGQNHGVDIITRSARHPMFIARTKRHPHIILSPWWRRVCWTADTRCQ